MLAYPINEAEILLEGKLSGAQQTLANCEEDLDFLREQITACLPQGLFQVLVLILAQTLEVATARVYNWDVTMKRKGKAESGEDGEKKNKGPPNG